MYCICSIIPPSRTEYCAENFTLNFALVYVCFSFNILQGKTTVLGELEKYQLSVKRISEELEKLKHAEGNLPQVKEVVRFINLLVFLMCFGEQRVSFLLSVILRV